jgi:DNA-binding NarL/FixJ family response regulator
MMGAKVEFSDSTGRPVSAMRRLVIVADNSLLVEAIRIGFRKSGEFSLVGHADGYRTSAHTILGVQPDVILLDDMDQSDRALELLDALHEEKPSAAVIVLSMHLDAVWLERVFTAGATGVISKATHPAALATLVRETLNGHIFHRKPGPAATAAPQSTIPNEDFPLTGRELEILQLVASGCTNSDVAGKLWVTEQTVKFHLRNIYRKLDVANRTQASHFAHVQGLVKPQAPLAFAGTPELSAVAN